MGPLLNSTNILMPVEPQILDDNKVTRVPPLASRKQSFSLPHSKFQPISPYTLLTNTGVSYKFFDTLRPVTSQALRNTLRPVRKKVSPNALKPLPGLPDLLVLLNLQTSSELPNRYLTKKQLSHLLLVFLHGLLVAQPPPMLVSAVDNLLDTQTVKKYKKRLVEYLSLASHENLTATAPGRNCTFIIFYTTGHFTLP